MKVSKESFILACGGVFVLALVNLYGAAVSGPFELKLDYLHLFSSIAICTGSLIAFYRGRSDKRFFFNLRKAVFFSLCLILYSFVTLQDINSSPLWLDEYTQIVNALAESSVYGAANEQQPPGGYAFSRLLADILGPGWLSAKMTGFIPMLAALAFLLVLFAERRKEFYFFGFVSFLFFVADPALRYLALEGRPIGFAVAGMCLLLLTLKIFLVEKRPSHLFLLSCSSFLFMLCAGLQTLAVVLLLWGLCLVFCLANQEKTFCSVFKALTVSLILYVPFQFEIISIADRAHQFDLDVMGNIKAWMNNVSLNSFLKYYLDSRTFSFSWVLALTGLLGMFLFWLKTPNKRKLFWFGLLYLILWPLCFEFSYNAVMNWALNWWYYVCFYALFCLATLIYAANAFGSRLCLIVASFLLGSAFFADTGQLYRQRVAWRPNWDAVHKEVESRPGITRGYVLGGCSLANIWCYNFFVGAEFHGGRHQIFRGYNSGDMESMFWIDDNGMIYDMRHRNKDKTGIAVVVLLLNYRWSEKEELFTKLKSLESREDLNVEVKKIDQFAVIFANKPKTASEHILPLLKALANVSREYPSMYYANELLLYHYGEKGDYGEMSRWFEKFKRIEGLMRVFENHSLGRQKLKAYKKALSGLKD